MRSRAPTGQNRAWPLKSKSRTLAIIIVASLVALALYQTICWHYVGISSTDVASADHGRERVLRRQRETARIAEDARGNEQLMQSILAKSRLHSESLFAELTEDVLGVVKARDMNAEPGRRGEKFLDFEKAEPMNLEDSVATAAATATEPTAIGARLGVEPVALPNFAIDYSEYAVGGVLERESDSFDLHVATFFVCHAVWAPKGKGLTNKGGLKILKGSEEKWKRAFRNMDSTKYHSNGLREQKEASKYYCLISSHDEDEDSEVYLAEGQFIPNMLTIDSNSNKRLDIFRCKVKGGEALYTELARHPTAHLRVDIMRGGNGTGTGVGGGSHSYSFGDTVIAYRIPWSTRLAGLSMPHPHPADSAPSLRLSSTGEKKSKSWGGLDAWKGYNSRHPGQWTHDNAYLCLAGVESPPSKKALPLFLEFLAHHLLLEVDHIMIALSFSWNSPHMLSFKRILQPYITADKVSLSSSCADGIDMAVSTSGLLWGRDNVKTFQTNLCSYFAKGMADYVLVLDVDEHLILPSSSGGDGGVGTIPQLLGSLMPSQKDIQHPQKNPYFRPLAEALAKRAHHAPSKAFKEGEGALSPLSLNHFNQSTLLALHEDWPYLRDSLRASGMKGLADGNAHPACYLLLKSAVTLYHTAFAPVAPSSPFIGQRFKHGHEPLGAGHGLGFTKAIRPTRNIYSSSLHVCGACRLPAPFNGCSADADGQHQNQTPVEGMTEKGEAPPGFCYNPIRGDHGRTVLPLASVHQQGGGVGGRIRSEFNTRHYFDEVTLEGDALTIDPEMAVVNHIQFHRFWYSASPASRAERSHYSAHSFPHVFREIDHSLGMVLPILLPRIPEADPQAAQADSRGRITYACQDCHAEFMNFSSPRAPYDSSSLPVWTHKKQEEEEEEKKKEEEEKLPTRILLNMCVSDITLELSQGNAGEILEFVQHHVLLGLAHIFLCVHFEWDSVTMRRYQALLDTYIYDGVITLHSCNDAQHSVTAAHLPHVDISSSSFFRWNDVTKDSAAMWKVVYTEVCLRLSRGRGEHQVWTSHYVAVASIDQFLIPDVGDVAPPSSLSNNVYQGGGPLQAHLREDVEKPRRRSSGSGSSSNSSSSSSNCPFALPSRVVPALTPGFTFTPSGPQEQWWVGKQFNRGPVSREGGLHQLYAADPLLYIHVQSSSSSSDEKSDGGREKRDTSSAWVQAIGVAPGRGPSCARELIGSTVSVLRFMTGRLYHAEAPALVKRGEATSTTNAYSSFYFLSVYQALKERNLDFVVELPESAPVVDHSAPGEHPHDITWLDYDVVYQEK